MTSRMLHVPTAAFKYVSSRIFFEHVHRGR
jgi:hypothetical protein